MRHAFSTQRCRPSCNFWGPVCRGRLAPARVNGIGVKHSVGLARVDSPGGGADECREEKRGPHET